MKDFLTRGLAKSKTFSWYIDSKNFIHNKYLRKFITLVALPCGIIANLFDNEKELREYKYNLSIVLIAKNEGQYIQEWIEYYKLLGFDKFYIFDNDSTDQLKLKLNKYIKQGLVDYEVIHGKARQMDAYNLALKKSKKESKYLAILDADEFIFQPRPKNNVLNYLNQVFEKNSKIGGIGINWLIFGSSHYKKQPKGLVTQTFLYRSKYNFSHNNLVKTICNPRKVIGVLNPHYVEYKKGCYCVNALGEYMKGPKTKNNKKMPIRINHYFTKSKEEFLKKRARGMADQLTKRNISDFELHDKNEVYDTGMLRYGKILKEKLERDI